MFFYKEKGGGGGEGLGLQFHSQPGGGRMERLGWFPTFCPVLSSEVSPCDKFVRVGGQVKSYFLA